MKYRKTWLKSSDKKEFYEYTFVMNNIYYIEFVKSHINFIKKNYFNYIECTNFNKLKKYLFYCELFHHAISTHHYYHIKNNGKKFKPILNLYYDMFELIKNYVDNMSHIFVDNNVLVCQHNMMGEIDLINNFNEIVELKVAQQINLKYILQVLMYNIMYNCDKNDYRLNFINFMRGEEIMINMCIKNEDKDKLIKIFQEYSYN
jgi:hypothetical protein